VKIKKSDIVMCKATILERFQARYWALFKAGQVQLESKKCSNELCEKSVALLQNSAVENLLQKKCEGAVMSGSSLLPSSTTHFPSILGAMSTCTTLFSIRGGSKHSPFASLSQISMESTMNMNIQKSNNATVEMAIADSVHCENIPDAVVESPRFRDKTGFMVRCHDASLTPKAAAGGSNPSTKIC
jgi:hypothetical protein